MAPCGYEATAVSDTVARPWKALTVALGGVRTDGPMAPELALDTARKAEFVFDGLVADALGTSAKPEKRSAEQSEAAEGPAGPFPFKPLNPPPVLLVLISVVAVSLKITEY